MIADFNWPPVLVDVGNLLFMLPLPILLVILFRSRAPLVVSRNLKYVAVGAAVTSALLFTLPALLGAISKLRQDWIDIQWQAGVTAAEKFWNWLKTAQVSGQGWAMLGVLSEMAFILLLLALFWNRSDPHATGRHRSGLLKTAAGIATIIAAVAVIANIAKQVYAAIEFSSIWCDVLPCPTRGQVMLHNALGTIPDLCRFIVPFIIYRSQPLPPVNPACVEAIPSETA
jgi:hypothetical protein